MRVNETQRGGERDEEDGFLRGRRMKHVRCGIQSPQQSVGEKDSTIEEKRAKGWQSVGSKDR